jgi:chromosome segregation ATPase
MGGNASKANKITPVSAEDNYKPLQQQIAQLQNEFESGKQQNAKVHQQLENSKQRIAQLQHQLDSGKQQNDQLQQRIENHQPSTAQFAREISLAAQRKDEAFMREIFNRHATKEKLSASALTAALKDVAAPVLAAASSEGSCDTAAYVFHRADANMSGDVDFAE